MHILKTRHKRNNVSGSLFFRVMVVNEGDVWIEAVAAAAAEVIRSDACPPQYTEV